MKLPVKDEAGRYDVPLYKIVQWYLYTGTCLTHWQWVEHVYHDIVPDLSMPWRELSVTSDPSLSCSHRQEFLVKMGKVASEHSSWYNSWIIIHQNLSENCLLNQNNSQVKSGTN